MGFVRCLECARCAKQHSHRELQSVCTSCGAPFLVRYDLNAVRQQVSVKCLLDRPNDMWRYFEVLPVEDLQEIVTLGEGLTPLLRLPRLGAKSGLSALYAKDESFNPTGSFKARGLSAAVSMARRLGVRNLALPSAGNAGGALASYAARAGLEAFVFLPEDTPEANVLEAEIAGAHVERVPGLITDAARRMNERSRMEGWFDLSTLKEPYRLEGKKTMGYEIAEQMQWKLPDVIVYPTGGGTGLIGMWKAFDEMEELGWIGPGRPRMVAVQAEGCAPLVKAFTEGTDRVDPWPRPRTFASGIRVPGSIGDFLIFQALRRSRGTAVSVSDSEIYSAVLEIGSQEGLFFCPEGAACWAAVQRLQRQGWISSSDSIVLFNTAAGTKYTDSLKAFKKSRTF